ncbi:MAG: TolC family protein [Rikenellaceae bacterium]
MKKILYIAPIFLSLTLQAQIPTDDYRQQVIAYSMELKSAEAAIDYATQTIAYNKRSRLPQLSASGNFRYLLHNEQGIKPTGIAIEPTIVQTIYSGGSNISQIKQAELSREIALCDAEYTMLEVEYAADYAYWNLWAMERYVASVEQYVSQIKGVRQAIKYRYDEGYTTKGDLLMITSQLNEAEYQLTTIKQSYLIALQDFNILRGFTLSLDVNMESIKPDTTALLHRASIDQIIDARPDYKAAILTEQQSQEATRQVKGSYNPQLTAGVSGSWYTHTPNYDHSTTLDGFAYLSLSVPIYRFGERRKAVARSQALERVNTYAIRSTQDMIVSEEASAWTSIVTSYAQLSTAKQSLTIASENLEISTYSYNEGLISIVELMQAQTSWINIFANSIESLFNYQIALSAYYKATGGVSR